MKKTQRLTRQFAVLLSIMIGLSGFVTTANAQSSTTHTLEQVLESAQGRPVGTPVGIIDQEIRWTAVSDELYIQNPEWDNDPNGTPGNIFDDIGVTGYIITDNDTILYGVGLAGSIHYTADLGQNWTTVFDGDWPNGEEPIDLTAVESGGTVTWFSASGDYIFEIINSNDFEERLDLSNMNSICSNMTDTIYIARGNNGEVRGYSIDDWTQHEDFEDNLEFGASIDWKNNKLLVIDGLNVWSRSTNSTDSWTELLELDPTGQWAYCSWLVDPSANQLDLAVGSMTFDKIQIWREITPPTPEFSADILSGFAPLEVNFTDESTGNPTSWLWTFGDGNTSDEENPVHQYDEAGEYDVSLTVSNDAGSNTETKVDYITVSWIPMDANFEANPDMGTAPLEVQFTDLSTGNPTAWLWNLGDGGSSDLQNPEYTYLTPGTYTVSLTVFGPGGQDTQVMEDLIFVQHPAPIADFEADPTGGTAPLDVNFVSLSTGEIDSYFWDFGDGGSSTEQNPDYIYDEAGEYDVTLTVDGPGGSDEMVKENYINVVEPAQVVITSFVGSSEVSFITLEEWFATFTQENGESGSVLSSLSNQYTVDFENGTVSIVSLTTVGLDNAYCNRPYRGRQSNFGSYGLCRSQPFVRDDWLGGY